MNNNYNLNIRIVNNNISGNAEVQPETKAGGVLMSNDVNALFAFKRHLIAFYQYSVRCFGVSRERVGDSPLTLLRHLVGVDIHHPAFVVNLPPVSGRGGVVVCCGYLDITPNLVRCLV